METIIIFIISIVVAVATAKSGSNNVAKEDAGYPAPPTKAAVEAAKAAAAREWL